MVSDDRIEARFELRFKSGFLLQADLNLPGRGGSAIYGHSGSGKTTLLRCMAGLQQGAKGSLCVCGETWLGDGINLPTHKRPLGFVFQEASLFPHLTAQGNLVYAERRASGSHLGGNLRARVVALMGLERLLDRRPGQLSGGERQRVALAAIGCDPQVSIVCSDIKMPELVMGFGDRRDGLEGNIANLIQLVVGQVGADLFHVIALVG